MKCHKDLDVWKVAMELSVEVYRITDKFPKHETYGLSQQLRRACVSIASNIAEGAARKSKREFVHFLYCALGSAAEVETQLELAKMLEYMTPEDAEPVMHLRDRVGKMLFGLIRSINR